jgi:hypothetical protein
MLGRLKGITFIWMLCALVLCVMTSGEALAQKPIKPPQKTDPPKTAPPPPAPAPVQADESAEDESRQIYFEYAEARPKKSASFSGGKPSGKRTRRYVRKTVKPVAQTVKTLSQVGVTLWRLRPSSASDDKETRILDQEEERKDVALTPVRVEADTLLGLKDKVRLSVESPRAGYLYVIDREVYADGTRSAPYLIFPTLRTRGGDNKVSAGMLVDIPALDDRPNYFTVKFSRPDQVGEELTMIVSDRPLDIPPLQRKYMKLDEETVLKWERDWKTEFERFEMEGGAGQVWTKEEKAAANIESSRLLDQDDPAPQTIYRVASKPGNPLMVIVPLRYPSMVK